MDDLISRADALAVVMHSRDPVEGIRALPGVVIVDTIPDSNNPEK